MRIRAAVKTDLDEILVLLSNKSINTADAERYQAMLATGNYRLEWTWLAIADSTIADSTIVAAAVWWGFPGGARPFALDGLFAVASLPEPVPVWTDLIRAGAVVHGEYHVFLAPDWRADAEVNAALTPRVAAAKAAGLTRELQRLRLEWTPPAPVPPRSTRLTLVAEPSDDVFLDVFQRVAEGSLDDGTRTTVARDGLASYARQTLEVYRSMPGPREWWRLAYHGDTGELVGFTIPSRNNAGPVVGFLGVVPGHRGHGYGDDLLAEITADLAGLGADRIAADTDVGNVPMARSFQRLGYRTIGVRLVLS